ncbi:hypothetical protein [Streptodolium elevatio]|uniref:Uncharacterized protein n=1 Tax=Streptodolium elevatio TaxID=3157996 RepID=A0ABV3D819_9ACTN
MSDLLGPVNAQAGLLGKDAAALASFGMKHLDKMAAAVTKAFDSPSAGMKSAAAKSQAPAAAPVVVVNAPQLAAEIASELGAGREASRG